jgi:hypothetical protein
LIWCKNSIKLLATPSTLFDWIFTSSWRTWCNLQIFSK